MTLDNPDTPEFAKWNSYDEFTRRVRHDSRYVWGGEVDAFLKTVLATIRGRDVAIPKGSIVHRAQQGIDWDEREDETAEPVGYSAARMKPRPHLAQEGRANAAGIPMLYCAMSETTAISEVRPWIGALVSVAQFKVLRRLKALDLSRGHGQTSFGAITFSHILGEEKPDAARKEKAVWIDIDNAFSRPVTRTDDAADYAPTQILAELFRNAGYDGLVYRSQFGDNEEKGMKGYNVVLFNCDDADAINCAPYEVRKVEIVASEYGNRWFSTKHSK